MKDARCNYFMSFPFENKWLQVDARGAPWPTSPLLPRRHFTVSVAATTHKSHSLRKEGARLGPA